MYWQHLFKKLQEARDSSSSSLLMRYNICKPWKTTSTLKQTRTTTIFSFGYKSCTWSCFGLFCWQNPCSSCKVELTWLFFLNIFSSNFVLRLPAVVLTNHCQNYTAFFLCALLKVATFFFLGNCFSHWKCICVVYFSCSNVVNSKVGKQANSYP